MKFIASKSIRQAIVATASAVALSSAFAATTIDATTMVQVGGRVQSVDPTTRTVTVINDAGVRESFQVGANVQGINQLKLGTRVVGSANRVVRLTVLDTSVPSIPPSSNGQQTVARVTHVDTQTGSIALEDTTGAPLIVQAVSPASANAIAPGSRVVVELISAVPAH